LGYVLLGKMIKNDNDEELAARAASGERAAFRELLTRHYDRVFRVVYSVLRNTSDAEDVTQEIWAAMPSKLRQWKGKAKLTSWLHRIALNAAKDSLRKSASRARTVQGYAEVESLSRGLQTALGTLSDDLRETAVLTLSEDMNFAQAADVLGVAEGTVAWRMSEIRKRLKALASKDDGIGQEALA